MKSVICCWARTVTHWQESCSRNGNLNRSDRQQWARFFLHPHSRSSCEHKCKRTVDQRRRPFRKVALKWCQGALCQRILQTKKPASHAHVAVVTLRERRR